MRGFLVIFAMVSIFSTQNALSYEGNSPVAPSGIAYFDGGVVYLSQAADGTIVIKDHAGNVLGQQLSKERIEEMRAKIAPLTNAEEVKAVVKAMQKAPCPSRYFLEPRTGLCYPKSKPY